MTNGVIIACSNNKGGSGKTCCSVTLAHALANREKRVLVCDLDTQCNATSLLLSPGTKTKNSLYELFEGNAPVAECIYPSQYELVDVLPNVEEVAAMFVRLAFACAVNVSPDILIVDEALAVGDAAFQRKCYEKFDVFKEAGKTILLVSHDMETVKRLCSRALLLNEGHLLQDAMPQKAVLAYFRLLFPEEYVVTKRACPADMAATATGQPDASSATPEMLSIAYDTSQMAWGSGGGVIRKIEIQGLTEGNVFADESCLTISYSCEWDIAQVSKKIAEFAVLPNIIVGCTVHNRANILVAAFNTYEGGLLIDPFAGKGVVIVSTLNLPPLAPGDYFFKPAIAVGNQENNVMLRWHENPIHLICTTQRPYTFGITHIKSTHTSTLVK